MPGHLTIVERDRLAELRNQGADQREIAAALGRYPSTISRKLRRNRVATNTTPAKRSRSPSGGGASVRSNVSVKESTSAARF